METESKETESAAAHDCKCGIVNFFKCLGKLITVSAHLAIIVGLVVAWSQYQEVKVDRRQAVAIDGIKYRMKDDSFIRSYARLEALSLNAASDSRFGLALHRLYGEQEVVEGVNRAIDDARYVLATYGYISLLLRRELADEEILKEGLFREVRIFDGILSRLGQKLPINLDRRGFDQLRDNLGIVGWGPERALRESTDKQLEEEAFPPGGD